MEASFSITPQERAAYEKHYDGVAKGRVTVPEPDATEFFLKSGLDINTIKQIWLLADFERDRTLDRDEFVIAFHLIRLKRKSPQLVLPQQCPPELVPPGKRGGSPNPMQMQGRPMMNMPQMQQPMQQSFGNVNPSLYGQQPNRQPIPPMNNIPNFSGPGQINVRQVEMQVNQLLDQSRLLDDQTFPVKQNTEQARLQIEQLRLQHSELELRIANQKQDLEKAQQERNQLNQDQAQLRSKIDVLGHESQGMQMQIQAIKQEVMRLEGLRDRASEEDKRQSGTLQAVQSELQLNIQQLVQVREELASVANKQLEFGVNKNSQEKQVEEKRRELSEARKQLISKNSEIKQVEAKLVTLQTTYRELDNNSRDATQQLSQLDAEYDRLSNQVQQIRDDVQQRHQKGGAQGKLMKLKELLNKAQQFIEEYYEQASRDFPSDEHHVTPRSPVSPRSSVNVFEPPPVTMSAQSFGDEEFQVDFDDDAFGAPAPIPHVPTPVSATSAKSPLTTSTTDFSTSPKNVTSPAPVAAVSNDFDDWGFGDSQPAATNSTSPKASDPFDEFSQGNSNNTSSAGWDDFGTNW
ncbi:actin cytoskeleton-regulatory complex protein pan-1 [Acrasis kona]|uniref:Actin cytoskeleton-regulatory complex protein pan-1 n=1 Tax=Acrasis kona TaxID=1008807 RepID=A0AAW2YNN1_9EUKA